MSKLLNFLSGAKERLSALPSPTLRHTWSHTLSLYPDAKHSKPTFSVTVKDDKTVPVLKLALILLGAVCVGISVAAIAKRIRKRLSAKKHRQEHFCCDGCLYSQIEE